MERKLDIKNAFAKLKELAPDSFVLRGSTILVEILPEEDVKTKGGIVLASDSAHKRGSMQENRLKVGEVLLVGEGYYDEATDESIPLDTKVGDVVILPKYDLSEISVWPGLNQPVAGRLALIKEASILFKYNGTDGYAEAKEALNGSSD